MLSPSSSKLSIPAFLPLVPAASSWVSYVNMVFSDRRGSVAEARHWVGPSSRAGAARRAGPTARLVELKGGGKPLQKYR